MKGRVAIRGNVLQVELARCRLRHGRVTRQYPATVDSARTRLFHDVIVHRISGDAPAHERACAPKSTREEGRARKVQWRLWFRPIHRDTCTGSGALPRSRRRRPGEDRRQSQCASCGEKALTLDTHAFCSLHSPHRAARTRPAYSIYGRPGEPLSRSPKPSVRLTSTVDFGLQM